jgi:hypothetical protein
LTVGLSACTEKLAEAKELTFEKLTQSGGSGSTLAHHLLQGEHF